VIVSWRRPAFVQTCLEHLMRLAPLPGEVIVVDASDDDKTAEVVKAIPSVKYIPFAGGAGHMTSSRNIGLLHATGEVIAFIDDDANARAGWLDGLLDAFLDPTVGAVAGRTCNGVPDEDRIGISEIGRLLPNGELTGNFAADPQMITDIDHGIGANMSFRRDVLASLGGLRDDFLGGGGVREDTDIFLRVASIGSRSVFAPDAVVDHVGAPHVLGKRFDYRYIFWTRRNHFLLLSRNYGLRSTKLRAWARLEIVRAFRDSHPNLVRRTTRRFLMVASLLTGLEVSLRKAGLSPSDPIRRDAMGCRIRGHLSRN
jgi:GT2 family glycosyltransferase